MKNEIKEFVTSFFKNIGSVVKEETEGIIISKVPASFQKFYGKNCPYKFSFKKSNNPDFDFLEKDNYLLKSIRSYLDNSAKNTLLKIDFEDNSEKYNLLNSLSFPNSIPFLNRLRKSHTFFMRFIFHTSFQYLNKKEKIIEEIFVNEKEIISGDLKEYTLEEGNPREISIPNIKEDYLLAKKELNERVNPYIEKISKHLEKHLEREIQRIENHTEKEFLELENNIKKNEEKLKSIPRNDERYSRQERILKNLLKDKRESNFEKEKEHQIKIERSRTNLNINSKLFNTTIIYYPIFIKQLKIKNEFSDASVFIEFDPLKKSFSRLKCCICEEEIEELILCSHGHISCKNCASKCGSCNKIYCDNCLKKKCDLCGNLVCSDCSTRCSKCGKFICKSHAKLDPSTKKEFCTNCLKRCERCFEFKAPNNFIKSKKTGIEVCESCYRKEVSEITKKSIFGKK